MKFIKKTMLPQEAVNLKHLHSVKTDCHDTWCQKTLETIQRPKAKIPHQLYLNLVFDNHQIIEYPNIKL